MPQNVPTFQLTDKALKVRKFLYDYWCATGHGPNLRDVHEATGLTRLQILMAYRELDLGNVLNFDKQTQSAINLKCPPFSASPSHVKIFVDRRFLAYSGCALESLAASKLPPLAANNVQLESYCPCCMKPISVPVRNGVVLEASPASALVHISSSPWDWDVTDFLQQCDSMTYAIDADHADRYEHQISRRGVLLTLEQACHMIADIGSKRMWDYNWHHPPTKPEDTIASIKALGVDVSSWLPSP